MADEIKLVIRMEGHGVTQLKGTVDQLKESVKRLSREPYVSNNQRNQLAQLKSNLDQLISRNAAYGKTVQSVNATMFRANKSGSRVSYGAIGTETLNAQKTKQMEQESRKQIAIQQRQAQKEAEMASQQASMRRRAVLGTIGFGGLQVGQQVSGMLDNINLSGALSPALGKIFGAFGSMFSDMFGNILSNLASAIGTAAESIANLLVSALRGAFKAAGSLLSGIAMSVISVAIGGTVNLAIGTVIGLLMASLSIIQSILESLVNLFKDAMKIIADLLTAAFSIIKGLFTTFGNIVSSIWKGIWDGFKATAQAAWDTIIALTKAGIGQLAKGFEDFVESERTAAKGFVQIRDSVESMSKTFMEGVKDVQVLQDSLRTDFGLQQAQAASGAYFALSSNFRTVSEASGVLRESAKLATVAQEDFNQVTRTTAAILNAYNKGAEGAGEATRALFGGVAVGSFELDELLQGMSSVIGSASKLNIPIEQLVGSFSALSLSGINAFKAGSGLNRMFEIVMTPTSRSAKSFKEMGIRVNEFRKGLIDLPTFLEDIAKKLPDEKLRDIFPTIQARRAFIGLMSNAERFRKIIADSANAGKGLDKNFEDTKGTFSFMINQLKQVFSVFVKNIAGTFSESFRPVFKDFSEFFRNLTNNIQQLDFSPITNSLAKGLSNVWNTVKQLPTFLGQVLGISINWNDVIKGVAGYVTQISNYLANPKTWEGLVKGAMTAAAYLKFGYEYIKQMVTDTQLFSKIFDLLGHAVKTIGIFLIETFKNAFEVAASYAQSTFLPVFKDIGTQFIIFMMKGVGDVLNAAGKGWGEDTFLGKRMMGAGFLLNDKARMMESPDISGRLSSKQDSTAIFNALKPIVDRMSINEKSRLATSASYENTPGISNKSSDLKELVNMLMYMKNSESVQDMQMKANQGGARLYGDEPNNLLNKIYFALVKKENLPFISGETTDQRTMDLLDTFMRSVKIETERKAGREKYGNVEFIENMNTSFTKFQDSMAGIVSAISPMLKAENPAAYDALTKQLEEISKIQFQVAEENKKAIQENTNALKESTQKKQVSEGMKHTRKLVSAAYADSYVARMRSQNPNSQVTSSGTIRTGMGPMRLVDIATPNVNKVAQKSVEEQKKQEKADGSTQAVVNEVKGVATLTEQMLDELKQINKKTFARTQFFQSVGEKPPMATEETYQDIWSDIN